MSLAPPRWKNCCASWCSHRWSCSFLRVRRSKVRWPWLRMWTCPAEVAHRCAPFLCVCVLRVSFSLIAVCFALVVSAYAHVAHALTKPFVDRAAYLLQHVSRCTSTHERTADDVPARAAPVLTPTLGRRCLFLAPVRSGVAWLHDGGVRGRVAVQGGRLRIRE